MKKNNKERLEAAGIIIFMVLLVIMTRAMFALPDEMFRWW